ncbi:MAG: paraquat-inducible protein A [Desulfosarcina sp.]|nr:paraquat-inducible protein A [Desulfobacterales bacterium]
MNPKKINISGLTACSGCDLLLKQIDVKHGESAFCPGCGKNIYTPKKNSIDKTLALSLTALILFLPAVFMPLMTFDSMGFKKSGSILDGIIRFYDHGYLLVSMIVLLTSLLFPLTKLLLLFVISINLKLKRYPDFLPLLMRSYQQINEWGMIEVYMIGILVSIIKMNNLAHIHYDIGFFCFIGLLMASLSSSATLDAPFFWNLIEKKGAS